MNRRQMVAVEWSLAAACLAPVVIGILAFSRGVPVTGDLRPVPLSASAPAPDGHLADSLLRGAVELAPFRLTRRPSEVAYQVGRLEVPADQSQPPKPVLSLSGIIWGRHPAALLEGVPGRDGSTLLQVGDTAAGLTLRSVARDRVVVTGMDTTWTLTMRQAWTQ